MSITSVQQPLPLKLWSPNSTYNVVKYQIVMSFAAKNWYFKE